MRRRPVALFTLEKRFPAETSNSRNVHPVSVTFRRFDFSTIRRIGGKAFRRQRFSAFRLHVAGISGRQRFSAFRLHVAGISGRLFGAARGSADRRPTLTAETPKRAKRAKRVSKTGPIQNRNIPGVPRGATKKRSTWNAYKVLIFNNLTHYNFRPVESYDFPPGRRIG